MPFASFSVPATLTTMALWPLRTAANTFLPPDTTRSQPSTRSASSRVKTLASTPSSIRDFPSVRFCPTKGQSVPKSTRSAPIRRTASPITSAGCHEVSTTTFGCCSQISSAFIGS